MAQIECHLCWRNCKQNAQYHVGDEPSEFVNIKVTGINEPLWRVAARYPVPGTAIIQSVANNFNESYERRQPNTEDGEVIMQVGSGICEISGYNVKTIATRTVRK